MPPSDSVSDNICILRFSAIGDVTHGVPVVRAIQGRLPNAHLHLFIGDLVLLAALVDIDADDIRVGMKIFLLRV